MPEWADPRLKWGLFDLMVTEYHIEKRMSTPNFRFFENFFESEETAIFRFKTNITKALSDKGFTDYRIKKEKLLSGSSMQKLRNSETTITLTTLNQICTLLDCAPWDILEFIPDDRQKES